jgi:hypothetical protein
MPDAFSPCKFHQHGPGSFSITFDDIDGSVEHIQGREGQGGGYSWESMIRAVLAMRSIELDDVDFDPEGDMFAAASANKASLETIAHIIKDLVGNRELMDEAITLAKADGYFE